MNNGHIYYRPKPSDLRRLKAESSSLIEALESKYGASFFLNVDDDWSYLNELCGSDVAGAENLLKALVEYGQLELEIM